MRTELLSEVPAKHTYCEWKGRATYFDLEVGGSGRAAAAWHYPEPREAFAELRGHIAFYAGRVDAAYLGDERVRPAGRQLLRRLGHRRDRGPVQGRARAPRAGKLRRPRARAAGLRWRANMSLTQRPPGRSRSGAKNSSIAGVPEGRICGPSGGLTIG